MDDDINSLVSQLKTNNSISKQIIKDTKTTSLDKDDLEQFVLNNSARLITDSMDMITSMKDYVTAGSDSDDIGAFAELFKASTHAMEILNKILIQNKRGETTEKVKQMDIDAKKQLTVAEHQSKMLLSRSDIVDRLMTSAEVLDTSVENEEKL